VILPDHLPPAIQQLGAHEGAMESGRSLDETTEDIEREMILSALSRAGGVQLHTARLLGITEQSSVPGSLRPAPLGLSN